MGLQLRADTFFCIANHRVALLDLKADRYFCLPLKADAAFQRLVTGHALDTADMASLEPFIRNGLLEEPPGGIVRCEDPTIGAPVASVVDEIAPTQWGSIAMLDAISTRLRASARIKRRSIHTVIAHIQQRKRSTKQQQVTRSYEGIEGSLGAFLQTRKVIPTHDRCLPWSIALVDYLAKRRYFPDLVIGVKMKPFAAHAWVQIGDRVLSDRLDEVLPYTPILVV